MFSRRLHRTFKHKKDYLQNSLENAYDLLNHRSYFHMLGNITRRVNLYNTQVKHLEDKNDETKALEYLKVLNGNQKYEEALIFASKWKYTWASNLTNFYGDGVSKLTFGNTEIKIRPVKDRGNRKQFKEQVHFAKEKLGKTIHRSMLLYNLITCISFMILVFPESTLDWLFWGKRRAEEAQEYINEYIETGTNKKAVKETKIEKDLGKKVYFKDVIGIDEFKDELMEIVDYLKHPEKYEEMGAYVPKGVLLCGRPGTGKTMLAQALANEAECSFIYKSGAEFDQIFVGSGARNVRDLFKKARKKSPAIIFIDEIDSIGGKRVQQSNNTLNQLLAEIDGFRKDERIILVGATNLADSLDPALTRPGRFDKKITIPNPDRKGREKLFQHYLSVIPLYKSFQADDTNPKLLKMKETQKENMMKLSKDLAAITPNFTGAEIQNIVNLTLCHTVLKREKLTPENSLPSLTNFRQVLSEIKRGPKKLIGNQISKVQLKNAALYEASKAVFGLFYGGKLTNSGFDGGYLRLEFKSEENDQESAMGGLEGSSFEKKDLEDIMKIKMAGKVYREKYTGEADTRAIGDWMRVSRLALGYSRSLAMNGGGDGYKVAEDGTPYSVKGGQMINSDSETQRISEGNLISVNRKDKVSEIMAQQIDQEAVNVISKCYDQVEQLLSKGLKKDIENVAYYLQKKEKLSVEEVKKIVGYKDSTWRSNLKPQI